MMMKNPNAMNMAKKSTTSFQMMKYNKICLNASGEFKIA